MRRLCSGRRGGGLPPDKREGSCEAAGRKKVGGRPGPCRVGFPRARTHGPGRARWGSLSTAAGRAGCRERHWSPARSPHSSQGCGLRPGELAGQACPGAVSWLGLWAGGHF